MPRSSVESRFWSKVEKTDTCWLWTASTDSKGYGIFRLNGRLPKAHRLAYEMLVGSIPPGLQLDHVRERGCTHRNCVNPAHLEPVTLQENVRRGDVGARNAAKTHCVRGHPFDDANTYVHRSKRHCRLCRRAAVAKSHARATRAKEKTYA